MISSILEGLGHVLKSDVGLVMILLIIPILFGEFLFFKYIVKPSFELFRKTILEINYSIKKNLDTIDKTQRNIKVEIEEVNQLVFKNRQDIQKILEK